MTRDDPTIDDLMRAALACERRGRWTEACDRYGQVLARSPAWALPYLCLGCALGRLDRLDQAAQVLSLGYDRDPRLLNLWRSPDTEPDVAARARYADALFRRFMTTQHRRSVLAYERQAGCAPLPRVRDAIWCQTHDRPFRYADARQRPWLLYLPQLPARPWFDVGELSWAEAFTARFPAIRDEVRHALHTLHDAQRPYLPAEGPPSPGLAELHGSPRWSSLHLYREGEAGAARVLEAFPVTRAALAGVDCVRLHGRPMEVVVSVLAPGTRIPPHFGLANTRLTVHLPITVPDGCFLTVGGETRTPRAGQLLAFDDGFRHEAANPTSAVRVHLIFEAWRPDLDAHERAALARCMEDRARWSRDRRLPEGAGVTVS